jgi:gluconolactonase
VELQDVKVVTEGLRFPEGPVAMPDGSVLVVELRGGALTRVSPDGDKTVAAETGGGPNGAAIGPDGLVYLCNNGGSRKHHVTPGIQRIDLATGHVEHLYTECDGRPLSRPNDLVFDKTGHFWFTDLGGDAIYYAASSGTSITRAIDVAVSGPNGIGLSPDETIVYWAQTYNRQVQRRRLTAPGQPVPSKGFTIMTIAAGEEVDEWALLAGLPGAQELDSLAIDGSGAVCAATLADSGITVISPDGEIEKYTLPAAVADRAVTNICFGGPDLQTAYVTLSLTGRLISCRWPRPGLRLNFQA